MPVPRALSTLQVLERRALPQVPQNRSPYLEMNVHRNFSKPVRLNGPYFIRQLALLQAHTVSRNGMLRSDCRPSNLPWVVFHAFILIYCR